MYGNDIQYEIELIKPDDYNKIQAFSCGNMKMDHFYHEELIRPWYSRYRRWITIQSNQY